MLFAPIITTATNLSTTPLTLQSSEPIKIYSICISTAAGGAGGGTGETTTVTSADGNTTIFTTILSGRVFFNIDIPFIADAGLRITASGDDTQVTVTHSHPGV